ncbi:MAG: hypothetical protein R3C13_13475 [Hyphomonas sp.]|uniref:DUF4440 domain-containing protein n=1 Tax=Hyphomonas sp. TaxID=87 RepID=UPI0035282909
MRRQIIFSFCMVWLAACASSPATIVTPEPIVAAERAFAAYGYASGVKTSFTSYAAPDAIMFAPDPVNVHDYFSVQPDAPPDPARPHLVWWPLWAGISRSGDLGFTSGPYGFDEVRRGWYFTIWQKQPDGLWKWVLDAGVDADPAGAAGKDAAVDFLPVTEQGSADSGAALAQVKALEAAMATDVANGSPCAYAGSLAPEARLHSEGAPPGIGAETRKVALAARPARMILEPRGGGASAAGDLVWTWSEASWDAGGPGRGVIVRVWQKRKTGWAIVFDELVPRPAP